MARITALVVALSALTASLDAAACRLVFPDPDNVPTGTSAFLGIVSGVRLEGLENRLLGKPDAYIDGVPVNLTGGASPVTVRAIPLAGPARHMGRVHELSVSQCRQAPNPGTKAVFVIRPDGKAAQLVLEAERPFKQWVKAVKEAQDER